MVGKSAMSSNSVVGCNKLSGMAEIDKTLT